MKGDRTAALRDWAQRRAALEAERRELAAAAYASGWTVRKIADELQVSRSTVYDDLRRAGAVDHVLCKCEACQRDPLRGRQAWP